MNSEKPQLHVSMLYTLSACGEQFRRRYGARFGLADQEEIIPPGIALAIGSATHKAVEVNLKNKIDTGELLRREEVLEVGYEEAKGIWSGGMSLTDEEAENQIRTKGDMLDMVVALAALHYDDVAPNIWPVAVEEKFVIKMKRYPFDLSGQIDVREQHTLSPVLKYNKKNGRTSPAEFITSIRDTKTAGRKPQPDVIKSIQMAMYSMAHEIYHGELPGIVHLDYLLKTKTPQAITITGQPDPRWIDPLMARVHRFAEIIDAVQRGKAPLTPAQPDDWRCTKKWCGYATSCPFWSGR